MAIVIPGAERFAEYLGQLGTDVDVCPGHHEEGYERIFKVFQKQAMWTATYHISNDDGSLRIVYEVGEVVPFKERTRAFSGIIPEHKGTRKPTIKRSDDPTFDLDCLRRYSGKFGSYVARFGEDPETVIQTVHNEKLPYVAPLKANTGWIEYKLSRQDEIEPRIRRDVRQVMLRYLGQKHTTAYLEELSEQIVHAQMSGKPTRDARTAYKILEKAIADREAGKVLDAFAEDRLDDVEDVPPLLSTIFDIRKEYLAKELARKFAAPVSTVTYISNCPRIPFP